MSGARNLHHHMHSWLAQVYLYLLYLCWISHDRKSKTQGHTYLDSIRIENFQ